MTNNARRERGWYNGPMRGLALKVADLQATYEALTGKSVEFEGPPIRQPWGIETGEDDPDGNGIVLQQA